MARNGVSYLQQRTSKRANPATSHWHDPGLVSRLPRAAPRRSVDRTTLRLPPPSGSPPGSPPDYEVHLIMDVAPSQGRECHRLLRPARTRQDGAVRKAIQPSVGLRFPLPRVSWVTVNGPGGWHPVAKRARAWTTNRPGTIPRARRFQRRAWDSNPQGRKARRFSRPLPYQLGLALLGIRSGIACPNRSQREFPVRPAFGMRPNRHAALNIANSAHPCTSPRAPPWPITARQVLLPPTPAARRPRAIGGPAPRLARRRPLRPRRLPALVPFPDTALDAHRAAGPRGARCDRRTTRGRTHHASRAIATVS